MDKEKDNKQIQTVILTLRDGRIVTFSGPAQVFPGDEGTLAIVRTQFTKPAPMPEGVSWGKSND